MTFVPAPNVVQVNQRATLFDQQIENVHYILTPPGELSAADVQAVADAANDAWIQNLLAVLTLDYIFRETYATDLTTQTAPAATSAAPAATTGLVTAEAAPANVALCVSLRTNGRGRSARGRQYISGLNVNDITGNQFDTAAAQAVVDAFNGYAADIYNAGYQVVVLSRYENKQPRTEALVQPLTVAVLTDTFIDSQRRRLTGRGS
jgi:hypothetical protein